MPYYVNETLINTEEKNLASIPEVENPRLCHSPPNATPCVVYRAKRPPERRTPESFIGQETRDVRIV